MRDIENIEELLNCYIDGELDERKSNEIRRLIDNDSEVQQLYDSLKRYKSLMEAVYQEPAPAGLYNNITAHLEREVLLADTHIFSLKAGSRQLMVRQLMTAAAVILLVAALFAVIFDIFVPASSRKRLWQAATSRKTVKQVLYEKPFADDKPQDIKIVPKDRYPAPLVAILTLKTKNPVEVDWFIAKALSSTNLFNQTTAVERKTGIIKYVINCDNRSMINLIQELSYIWPKCTETKADIGTEQIGKYISINNISTEQLIEICKAENASQRLRMANDLATINKFTAPNILERIYASADIDYEVLTVQKPVLTSTEPTEQKSTTLQPSDNTSGPATLTITVVRE